MENEEYAGERLTIKRDITVTELEELGISFSDTAPWNALSSFYDNSWFERTWVVQEPLPAQVKKEASDKIEAKIITGPHVLWWDEVKHTVSWIIYKGDNRP
jgi:hypothetical protein